MVSIALSASEEEKEEEEVSPSSSSSSPSDDGTMPGGRALPSAGEGGEGA